VNQTYFNLVRICVPFGLGIIITSWYLLRMSISAFPPQVSWRETSCTAKALASRNNIYLTIRCSSFRVQTVLKCAWAAKNLGYKVFAIRKSGECLTSVNASKVYQRDGTSTECHGGEGGYRAMDVYKLKGK